MTLINKETTLPLINQELLSTQMEKQEQAVELIKVNKELDYQNEEREKRAAELAIANKELVFQNKEKEMRANELIIANKELVFQNAEKEKRAIELLQANEALKKSDDDLRKLTEELEMKVIERTAQLEITNKELEAFSYSVSHDLRAPIRAVSGFAKILVEDFGAELEPEALKYLQLILNDAKRMGHLIDDLLAFSKLGRKQVSVSAINMTSLIEAVKEEVFIDEKTNSKTRFILNPLPHILGDPSLIKQVWVNLISNAVKYSRHKTEVIIEIGAFEKEDQTTYFIKDNGAGFEMEYYDKLFGVFQRLHSQEEFEGTGIGLAIVQKIIQRHGGKVWAESKVDEGTCFYFTLPKLIS